MMPKWAHLLEAYSRETESTLLRQLSMDAGDAHLHQKLKNLRIRTGQAHRFNQVVALPQARHWRNRWVTVHRWEPRINDERFSDEYGYNQDDWEDPWFIGVGAGFLTMRFLVYATNESDAYSAAREQWPDEFISQEEGNSESDYEYANSIEIRLIERCTTWEIGRRASRGIELLDGRIVDPV